MTEVSDPRLPAEEDLRLLRDGELRLLGLLPRASNYTFLAEVCLDDRAALSVSNNIAEGFERSTTHELQTFIAIARGSSGEVRSMVAVVKDRPKLKRYVTALQRIRGLAESCARQLTGWAGSIDRLPFEGKREELKLKLEVGFATQICVGTQPPNPSSSLALT